MNKPVLVVVGITLAVGAAFFIFTAKPPVPQTAPLVEQGGSKTETGNFPANTVQSGSYVEYSKAALENATGRRVLFFYASWCPTCRPADADFQAKQDIFPSDVTMIRVNYNDPGTDQEEKDLAEKYGVTYQHTFVQIDESGKEISTWNGGQTAELLKNIK